MCTSFFGTNRKFKPPTHRTLFLVVLPSHYKPNPLVLLCQSWPGPVCVHPAHPRSPCVSNKLPLQFSWYEKCHKLTYLNQILGGDHPISLLKNKYVYKKPIRRIGQNNKRCMINFFKNIAEKKRQKPDDTNRKQNATW